MDYRDVTFWVWEARKYALRRKRELFLAARYAMAENEDFEEEMTRIEYQLINVDEGD
jgi:hypothetical protein